MLYIFQLRRLQSTLVVAEHNNEVLSPATQNTLSAAKKIGGDVAVLVAGTKCGPVSILTQLLIDFVYYFSLDTSNQFYRNLLLL